jgi:hypothetical protein
VSALERHAVELEAPPADSLAALAQAAEEWGARWEPAQGGGRLTLPVVFGLRRGVAIGRVEAVRLGDARARLTWSLEESHLEVHRGAVAVLALAVGPALAALAWPFWPPLLGLAPLAAVMGFAAWWLVVARLRSSGPVVFVACLAAPAAAAEGPAARR